MDGQKESRLGSTLAMHSIPLSFLSLFLSRRAVLSNERTLAWVLVLLKQCARRFWLAWVQQLLIF